MLTTLGIITLTTDFGCLDPYVGVMKGVILGINPGASLVDLSHEVEPQNVRQGAFLLGKSCRFFPPQAIHIGVIDPGVGSDRRLILLNTPQGRFLAPDNGVLSYVLLDGGAIPSPNKESQVDLPPHHRAYNLTNPKLWLETLSSTFHGRDIIAPVAGYLSLGTSDLELGSEITSLSSLDVHNPVWEGFRLEGRIVHIDRFGNLITDIPAQLLDNQWQFEIEIKDQRILGLSHYYAQTDGLLALIGSYDTLEIAMNMGNASSQLGARIGDIAVISRRPAKMS